MTEPLRYRHHPADPEQPTIVLIPGLFSGSFIWSLCEPGYVEAGFGVLVFEDALGQAPKDVASVDHIAREIDVISRSLAPGKRILAGNSIGAQVALEIASHNAPGVDQLLLSGCPGIGTEATYDLGIKKQRSITESHAHDVAHMLFTSLDNIPESEIMASFRLVTDRRNASTIIRFIQDARHLDVQQKIRETDADVLLLWGDNDNITPLSQSEAVEAGIAADHLVMFEHCGHCPMLEQPERFLAMSLDFINQYA